MEQEFSLSTGSKILYGFIGLFFFAGSMFLLYNSSGSRAPLASGFVCLLLLAFSILFFLLVFRKKLLINDQSITYTNIFQTRQLLNSNIKGCRIEDKYLIIEPLSIADKRIAINNYMDFADSKIFVQWLRDNFKNLDAIDLENEHEQVLQDAGLGTTAGERETKLKQAVKVARIYNIAGFVLGFACIPLPNNISIYFYILYPLLAILLVSRYKGLIRFFSSRYKSVYPNVMIGFAVTSVAMMIVTLKSYDIFKIEHIWTPLIIMVSVIFLAIYKIDFQKYKSSIKGAGAVMFVLTIMYAIGVVLEVNCTIDSSIPQIYKAQVLAKHITKGRSTSYYFTLSAWGPRESVKDVTVGRNLYNSVNDIDSVSIIFKKGLLNIPWFKVDK